jgi:septal ring factor EnvC (AmiA/AmiB activator)
MVDTARSTASQAERTADEAVSRTQGLESAIAEKQTRIRELEQRKQKLEGELAEFTG